MLFGTALSLTHANPVSETKQPFFGDPEKRRQFLESIRGGNYRNVACMAVGTTKYSLRRFLQSDDPAAAQFKADIEAAEAFVEATLVNSVIRMANEDNFAAAQWYLATKFQSRWASHAKELKEALKLLREIGEQRKSDNPAGETT